VVQESPDCENHNRNYFRNLSLSLKNAEVNFDVDLISPLVSGVRINLDFFTRKPNSKTYQSFYQYSFDMCTMMNNQKNNMFKRWFSSFFSHGNLKAHCPVPAKHYYIRKYNINNLVIPTFLFTGFYRLTFNVFQNKNQGRNKDLIVSCSVEVEIK